MTTRRHIGVQIAACSIFSLAILVAGCAESAPSLPGAVPTRFPASDLPEFVENFAADQRISVANLTFLESSLFVGTNVGLLRIKDQKIESVYRWYKDYNVIEGPWYGANRSELWMVRLRERSLIRFNGKAWQRVSPPVPPEGFFGRGEFVKGFEGTGKPGTFYLVGSGDAWTWTRSGDWEIHPLPPQIPTSSGIVGVTELEDGLVYVMHLGVCSASLADCEHAAYWKSESGWLPPVSLDLNKVVQVVSASEAVFVRGEKGELFRVFENKALKIEGPEPCEAIARTSKGGLLASFTGAGVYRLGTDLTWKKLLDYPYSSTEGEHIAYLAEDNGIIAYATSSVPQRDLGFFRGWEYSGSDALWISEAGRLRRIPW